MQDVVIVVDDEQPGHHHHPFVQARIACSLDGIPPELQSGSRLRFGRHPPPALVRRTHGSHAYRPAEADGNRPRLK
jgi:hypothetical protein